MKHQLFTLPCLENESPHWKIKIKPKSLQMSSLVFSMSEQSRISVVSSLELSGLQIQQVQNNFPLEHREQNELSQREISEMRSSTSSFVLWADAEHVGRNLPTRILEEICNNILPGKGWTSCPVLSSHYFFFQGPNDSSGPLGPQVPWAMTGIPSQSYFCLD